MSFLGFGVRASAFRGICRLLSIARQGGPSSKAFGFSSLGALGVYCFRVLMGLTLTSAMPGMLPESVTGESDRFPDPDHQSGKTSSGPAHPRKKSNKCTFARSRRAAGFSSRAPSASSSRIPALQRPRVLGSEGVTRSSWRAGGRWHQLLAGRRIRWSRWRGMF